MTFGAGSTFGSLSPWMMNRGQTPVQRPTGPTNLAQQMMGGQQGQGFGGLSLTGSPMPQQQAASAQPSAGGRIPVSGLGGAGLQGLFAEADKAAAAANNAPYSPQTFLTGSPPKTADEAWAQQQADNKALQQQSYKFAMMRWNQNGQAGPKPHIPYAVPGSTGIAKDMFFRNFNGSTGMSPGTTEASTAAQQEAAAFLKTLGL